MPKVFVELPAGGADPADRRAALSPGAGHGPAVGEQHRERRVPAWARPGPSTTSSPAAGSRRRTSPDRGRSPRRRCRRTSRRSRSSTSARACSRRCPAPIRRPRPCCSRRSRRPRASTRRRSKAPEVAFQGDPQFEPIEQTTVQRAVNTDKDVFKVGDLYYMCYQGVWFVGKSATGPWEVAELGAAGDLPDSGQLSRESRDLRHRRGQRRRRGSRIAAAAGYTGMMVAWGCTVWGSGWYYPPYYGLRRLLSVLLPALPDLRLLGLVQPVDRRLRPERRRLRSVRRRRRRRTLQPAHRHLRARRGGVRTVRRARRRAGLQPAHRHLRARRARDRTSMAAGDRPPCSAATTGRRPIATPTTGPAPRRARSGPTRAARSRGRGADGGRSPPAAAATSTPARTATSIASRTAPGRSTTTAAGRTRPSSRAANGPRPVNDGERAATDRSLSIAARRISSIAIPRARSEGATRTNDYGNYRGGSGTSGTGSYRGGGGARRWRRRRRRRAPAIALGSHGWRNFEACCSTARLEHFGESLSSFLTCAGAPPPAPASARPSTSLRTTLSLSKGRSFARAGSSGRLSA